MLILFTHHLSPSRFTAVEQFILGKGDRLTYCNMFNNNPHYSCGSFDVFLDPTTGQHNINCDPALSGFNRLTIRDWNDDIIYYSIMRCDSETQYPGAVKGNTYLTGIDEQQAHASKEKVKHYLEVIFSLMQGT